MHQLSDMTQTQVFEYSQKKQKKFRRIFNIWIPFNIFLSIVCMVAGILTEYGSPLAMILIYGVGTGIMGTIFFFWLRHRIIQNNTPGESGKIQYTYVRHLIGGIVLEFVDCDGNVRQKEFDLSKQSAVQNGEGVFVVYLPDRDWWNLEAELPGIERPAEEEYLHENAADDEEYPYENVDDEEMAFEEEEADEPESEPEKKNELKVYELKQMSTTHARRYFQYRAKKAYKSRVEIVVAIDSLLLAAISIIWGIMESRSVYLIMGVLGVLMLVIPFVLLVPKYKQYREMKDLAEMTSAECHYIVEDLPIGEYVKLQCEDGTQIAHKFSILDDSDFGKGGFAVIIYVPAIERIFAEDPEVMRKMIW